MIYIILKYCWIESLGNPPVEDNGDVSTHGTRLKDVNVDRSGKGKVFAMFADDVVFFVESQQVEAGYGELAQKSGSVR